MGRSIAGIVLLILFVFTILVIVPRSDNPTRDFLVFIAVFGLPGGLLLYLGQRYRTRRKAIINTAFLMLKASRSIDVVDLASRVGLSEDFVAHILVEARRKGLISKTGLDSLPSQQPGRLIICPRCHMQSPVGAKYCSNCGYALFDSEERSPSS